MSNIFISYARDDRETARRFAEALEGYGWSVWWDTRLRAGKIWDEMIETELKAAGAVVVLWSAQSVSSRWVRKEARYGDIKSMLVPALIEAVDIPFEFSDVHAENLCDWTGDPCDRKLRKLVDALREVLGEPPGRKSEQTGDGNGQPEPRLRVVTGKRRKPRDLPDLSLFRDMDEPWCPEMVILPAGDFMMGSPDTDVDAMHTEKPRRKVTIANRIAVGRFLVTFEEYDLFCAATKREKPKDMGWGRGRRPAIKVNLKDAKAHAAWLSTKTGKPYRLLSEAEWEYACRAGTVTRYSCGDNITSVDANYCQQDGETTDVGSYPPNPWGLFDMHGNVWEWVEDIWHNDYKGAPDGGSAWTTGGERHCRVLRGGSYINHPRDLRSALRYWSAPRHRSSRTGFRVARNLPPKGAPGLNGPLNS